MKRIKKGATLSDVSMKIGYFYENLGWLFFSCDWMTQGIANLVFLKATDDIDLSAYHAIILLLVDSILVKYNLVMLILLEHGGLFLPTKKTWNNKAFL